MVDFLDGPFPFNVGLEYVSDSVKDESGVFVFESGSEFTVSDHLQFLVSGWFLLWLLLGIGMDALLYNCQSRDKWVLEDSLIYMVVVV